MARENVLGFYKIKNEIEDLTDKLVALEEDIGNQISVSLQKKLRKLVEGYVERLELGYQMMLEWDFCDDIEKESLNTFFDDLSEQ